MADSENTSQVKSKGRLCSFCIDNTFSLQAWKHLWAAQPYQSNNAFVQDRLRHEIEQSVQAECWICTALVTEVVRSGYKNESSCDAWKLGYSLGSPVAGSPRKINVLIVKIVLPAMPWSRRVEVSFSLYAEVNSPIATHIMSPELDPQGLAVPLPNMLKTWLHQCRSSHASCAGNANVELPTRLLDTQAEALYEHAVRLRVSTPGENGEYAALSYCWGEVKNRFTITRSTVEAATKGLDWSALHKTYQDAIRVCRHVGIRYLWIDAVCILQDRDNSDKSIELPRMHQYYKHAALVISAADAVHADSGFLGTDAADESSLQQSSETTTSHCTIPAWNKDGASVSLMLGVQPRAYQPAHTAIESRAWTLQERLLCPRIMHFLSDKSIIMVCDHESKHNELVVFETFYPPRDSILRLFEGDAPFYESFLPVMSSDVSKNHHVFGSWLSLVAAYGRRRLTAPSDKLVAFASLAEEYYLKHKDFLGDYYAGVWSKKLIACLCWTSRQVTSESHPYRAPSWSWASVDGAYYDFADEIEIDEGFSVSDVSVNIQLGIPGFVFGPIKSAELHIRARCRNATWQLFIKNSEQHRSVHVLIPGRSPVLAQADRSDQLPSLGAEHIVLLALGRRNDPHDSTQINLTCLVLKEVGPGHLDRVGILDSYRTRRGERSLWEERAVVIR